MPRPNDEALRVLIERISAGESIDPDSISAALRADPALQRVLKLSRIAQLFDRRFESVGRPAEAPMQIGPWRVLRKLGSGGMGEVWLGERSDGAVEQRVAIKCVRVDSADFRERLLSERRLLARLEHPNIARFIDAGVEADGSPWFALEAVDGSPITDWCAARVSTLRERLQLFGKVCGAVEHAHRHLIVHRDLKPGNVIVNAQGEPKLLDFGIAKLLDGSTGENTVAALTPSYAAPEQLRGEAVSTATDVYALGLLLFRLLAGSLPPSRRSGNAAEVLAGLDSEETQRPSRCVDEVANALPYPATALSGDLDAIVAQALRARPESRYGSVAELNADIERHLDARPVRARAPTRRYRLARFARRNAVAAAFAALAAIAMVVGTVVSLQQAKRATQQAEQTQRELRRAETVSEFLATMYREQDPLNRAADRPRTAAQVLSAAVTRVSTELGQEPQIAARLLGVLGEAQLNLGDLGASRSTLDAASSNAQASGDVLRKAEMDSLRGALALREMRQDDAERLFASALAAAVGERGVDSLEAARIEARQATSLVLLGQFKLARGTAEHAQRVLIQHLGTNHPESISAQIVLANILDQLREDAAAHVALRAVVAAIENRFGPRDARLVGALQTLGEVLRRSGDYAAARTALLRGAKIGREQFGPHNAQVSNILVRLAGVERDAGDLHRATEVLDEAEAALPEGEDNAARAQLLSMRGSLWLELVDGKRAEADYRAVLELRRSSGDQRSGVRWFAQAQVGQALALQGRYAEAHRLQAEAAAEVRKLLGKDAYQNGLIATRRARTYEMQKDFVNAIGQRREAVRLIDKTYGPDHFGYFDWSLRLAHALAETQQGRAEAAQIVDALRARWTGKPAIARDYADLVLLRCRLFAWAAQPQEAAELARAALADAGLQASSEQRQALRRHAGDLSH